MVLLDERMSPFTVGGFCASRTSQAQAPEDFLHDVFLLITLLASNGQGRERRKRHLLLCHVWRDYFDVVYSELIVSRMSSESFQTHHYMPLWGTTPSICQERRTASLKWMVWLEAKMTKHKINKKSTNHWTTWPFQLVQYDQITTPRVVGTI